MNGEMETGSFRGRGGTRLFYRCWRPPAGKARAVLVFCHGLGEHSNRYQFPVQYFSQKGFVLYLPDLRGHGYSEGVRGYADSIGDFEDDLRFFLKFVQKREKGKLFLVGHSFGGQIVLNLLAHSADGIEGAVLSSPNIRLALGLPIWKRLAAKWLSLLFPRLALGNEINPEDLTHDPEVVAAWRADPQIQTKLTLKLGQLILENQDQLPRLADGVRVPCLFLHGSDDPICSPEGTRDFCASVPAKDKAFRAYKGFFHEIFNEVGRERVFRDMERWLDERL